MMRGAGNARLPVRAALAIACAALLLLTSGVTRLLVVCVGPHDGPRVEFAHRAGRCADHAAADTPREHCCGGHHQRAAGGHDGTAAAPHCSDSWLAVPSVLRPEPERRGAPCGTGDPAAVAPATVVGTVPALTPRAPPELASDSGPPPGVLQGRRLRGVLLLI